VPYLATEFVPLAAVRFPGIPASDAVSQFLLVQCLVVRAVSISAQIVATGVMAWSHRKTRHRVNIHRVRGLKRLRKPDNTAALRPGGRAARIK